LEDAERVVVSKGVELTSTQISKINRHIMEYGVGLGVVFIHRLTPSDINQNQMVMSIRAFHYMCFCSNFVHFSTVPTVFTSLFSYLKSLYFYADCPLFFYLFAAHSKICCKQAEHTMQRSCYTGDGHGYEFVGQDEYFTSTDGRIRFRNGWTEFASNNELEAGMDTVILFFKIDNKVHFNFCTMF
jgi:hypothetical protein